MLDILQTAPRDWKYVSEGGATIVFSYVGPSDPDLDRTVLRLSKSPIPTETSHKVYGLETCTQPEDDSIIEFQTKCMPRLIPPEHLPRLKNVAVHRSWLEELSRFHHLARPDDRRRKDDVDLNKKKGILATDLVGGHWLAVEIKPKWAFLPSGAHLSAETKPVKMQTCRFCMHSHLRAQKSGEEITNYCPLDLFSGEENRVLLAIHNLWDAWVASNATINNLKIFAGGKFLTPSECHLMFSEGHTAGLEINAIRDAFATALVQPLLRTPVLRILSDLQRNLDFSDIEGVSKLWKLTEASIFMQVSQSSETAPMSTPLGGKSRHFHLDEPSIFDWTNFLDTYTSAKRPDFDYSSPSLENLHYHLLAYLLSATFKDCSVIVKLDYLQPSPQPVAATPSDSVTVIDLDPKSMSKLKDWERLDKEIVRAYTSVHRKTCVDAWKRPGSISS